jgi:type VI secretion system TssC-like protein
MSADNVMLKSAQEIIGTRSAAKAIEEIFNVIHPAPTKTALKDIFTAESASQFLDRVANFSALLSDTDSYTQALKKLDDAIAKAEKTRDDVLSQLYEKIRPLERSYRQLHLFFENADVRDGVQRPPVEFFIFNADTKAITKDADSSTIVALDEFIQSRNDSFNFRQFICNLVVPGYVPDNVRKRLEDIANQWGMLLIGDLKDEKSFRSLSDQFRTDGGAYEFLKRPEDKAAADVVVAGFVKLRDKHWFEKPDADGDDADLFAPASMLFAGSLARTDRTTGGGIAQGPVGMIFGKIRGVEKSRIEPRISQMEHLSMERQIVTIIRNEDNDLCFVGSRSQAEDPKGVLKFFTSYRVLRYLERRIAVYLRRVAEQRLTRDLVKEQVRNPIEEFLEDEKKKGTIYNFSLDIDMDEDKFAMGVLDIGLEVLPVGPAETFNLKIDTPKFDNSKEKK